MLYARYLGILLFSYGLLWAQRLRSREKCTGPSCSEKVRVEDEKPRRRSLRRAETRVDRFGYPKRPKRYERLRMEVYSPRHKPLSRQEAFSPYQPSVRHRQRTERFGIAQGRVSRRSLSRAERQSVADGEVRHRQRAERFGIAQGRVSRRSLSRAERQQFMESKTRHAQQAENLTLPEHTLRRRTLPLSERLAFPLPAPTHSPRAEYYRPKEVKKRHKAAPEGALYTQKRLKRRRPSRSGCEPPPIPHNDYAEQLSCKPQPIPRINFDKYSCESPSVRHRPPQSYERQSCDPPPIPHKNFDRYTCSTPNIAHRSPKDYDVPCDAQRRGVMTATERFGHDLRYIFTNHKKHCEVVSAYSGVSIGEWVNTESYGRVPVAGYVMGYRTHVFAHFYDKKGRPLKKPRLERRKVWALKQLEVWVSDSTQQDKGKRRYIKGLPGIEGFGGGMNASLVRRRLSVQETRAVQIEKLIRKRQIAWLVRAYPEERVRLPEWLKKYAGPKPAHFWPGVDYRLLEIW
ncbi:MAG: hypothetical protein RML92_01530 [Bacteroidia bacterium]|nr:hypothetical protein [Bacteroidia bacterium]